MPEETKQYRLSIAGMSCAGCVAVVEETLQAIPGVREVKVNFAEHTAMICGEVSLESLLTAIQQAGYRAAELQSDEDWQEKLASEKAHYHRLLGYSGWLGGTSLLLMVGGHLALVPSLQEGRPFWLWMSLITLVLMSYGGRHFFIGAFHTLKRGSANMDTLVVLGTGTAWIYSTTVTLWPEAIPTLAHHAYFEASLMILALINLGSALESQTRGKTSEAVRQLLDLKPKTAHVIRQGKEQDILLGEVGLGEILRVCPGERIPVDGMVLEGYSTVDESMFTGEAAPVDKQSGSAVIGGTLNGSGTFLYQAEKIGKEMVISQMIEMVRTAQASKPEIARLVDRVAAIFVPVVVAIAVLTFVVWLIWGPEPKTAFALVAMMSVLLIACPCALGLATPISLMMGVGRAAMAGILIRNGQALQKAEKLTTLVLDKTGTVTTGKMAVIKTLSLVEGFDTRQIIAIAAGLERGSEHPLGKAILATAEQEALTPVPVENFLAVHGYGVQGNYQGDLWYLGKESWLKKIGIDPIQDNEEITSWDRLGYTTLFLVHDRQVVGVIALHDPIKPQAVETMMRLKQSGLKIVLLTGDRQGAAEYVAKAVGIEEFHAEMLPAEKAAYIQTRQQAGEVLGMVGDGVNDAPALATADVGFAIGNGTDIAIESADMILLGTSLYVIVDALKIARATMRNIRQNLLGAFFYNVMSIPIAAGILYPFFGILLTPVIASFAMTLSSLTVVGNASRLRWLTSTS